MNDRPLAYTLAALLSLTAACGDDEGTGTGGGSSSGGGSSEGAGAGTPGGACEVTGASIVAAPRVYDGGSVIVRLRIEGEALFFNTVDAVHRVDRAGGEPTTVVPAMETPSIYPPFWVRGDELVVGRVDELVTHPAAGGEPIATATLPVAYSGTLSGDWYIELAPDGATFLAKNDPFTSSEDTPSLTYFAHDLDAGASRILLEGTPIGHGKMPLQVGDHVYTTDGARDPLDPDDRTPDTLHRIPVDGGPAEPIPVTGDFVLDVIGADDTHLFLGGRPVVAEGGDFGGVYRLPLEGGTPEKVIDGILPDVQLITDVVALPDRVLVRVLDTVYAAPHGEGEATALFTSSCAVHAFTARGADVYLAVFDDEAEESSIVHVPLE